MITVDTLAAELDKLAGRSTAAAAALRKAAKASEDLDPHVLAAAMVEADKLQRRLAKLAGKVGAAARKNGSG